MNTADLMTAFPYSINTRVLNDNRAIRGYRAMYRPRYRNIMITDDLTGTHVTRLTVRDQDTASEQLAAATTTLLNWSSDRSTVEPFRVLGINA